MAMSRDDVKAIFPDATDEQISAFLNSHHNDVKTESATAAKTAAEQAQAAYNTALANLKAVQKQADDNNAEKNDVESRLQALQQSFEAMKAENAKLQNRATAISAFTTAGISADQYEPLLEGIVFEDGEKTAALTTSIIAAITAAREAAKGAAKQELVQGTPAPAAGTPPAPPATPQEEYNKALQSGDRLAMIRAANAMAAANAAT